MDDNLNQYEGGPGGPGNGSGGPGGPGGPGGSGSSGNDPRKQSLIMLAVAAIVTLLCISMFMKMMTGATNQEISYNAFIEMIEKEQIESVTVESDRVVIYPKQAETKSPFAYGYGLGTMTYYTGKMEDDDTLTKRLLEKEKLGIREVASRTGFRDGAYFSSTFRRLTGQTPSEYQESVRKKR